MQCDRVNIFVLDCNLQQCKLVVKSGFIKLALFSNCVCHVPFSSHVGISIHKRGVMFLEDLAFLQQMHAACILRMKSLLSLGQLYEGFLFIVDL